jgi:hypothetical protein
VNCGGNSKDEVDEQNLGGSTGQTQNSNTKGGQDNGGQYNGGASSMSGQAGDTSMGGSGAVAGGGQAGDTSMSGSGAVAGGGQAGDTSIGGSSSGNSTSPMSGVWYGYLERILGFVTVRVTSNFAEGDCSISLDGLNDSTDFALIKYEGTCHSVENGWEFRLTQLTVNDGYNAVTTAFADEKYTEVREKMWGKTELKQIVMSVGTDGKMLSEFDLVSSPISMKVERSADDAKYVNRRGTYPELTYLGLNFHRVPQEPSISLEVMRLGYIGSVTSVVVSLQGPGEKRYDDIPLTYDSEELDYGTKLSWSSYPDVGLWFIAEALVTTDKGSTVLLSRETPYDDYTQSLHSSTGAEMTGMLNEDWYRWVAQDYVPPELAVKWLWIEGYHNGSMYEEVDPALFAYRSDETSRWFAANDDGGNERLMPALKVPVVAGERIYVEVRDPYGNGGSYSVFASLSNASRVTTTKVVSDEFEPDNDAKTAKSLALDTFQGHLLQAEGESDWLAIDIPLSTEE